VVELEYPALLHSEVGVIGLVPGLEGLKGYALLSEACTESRVADVVDACQSYVLIAIGSSPAAAPGNPSSSNNLAERLNRHGITRTARIAALDALLATVPSPVLANWSSAGPGEWPTGPRILGTDPRRHVALQVQSRADSRR
jgi:hypothetical protein